MDLSTSLPSQEAPHPSLPAPSLSEDNSRKPNKLASGVVRYLDATVDGRHVDLIVVSTCFTTGLIDTVMFSAYGTFVSMQTGNTIFVALGASNQSTKPFSWVFSLLSICCYSLGALFFARLNTLFLPPAQRRATLMASFLIQAVFILVSVITIQSGAVHGGNGAAAGSGVPQWNELIPIAFLSFQSAGQIVNSRAMNINEVPTVVITSLLCDLFSDPKLLAAVRANIKRNRRIAGFLLLLIGAITSGWILKATGRVEPVLWVAAGLKLGMFLAWAIWPWMQLES